MHRFKNKIIKIRLKSICQSPSDQIWNEVKKTELSTIAWNFFKIIIIIYYYYGTIIKKKSRYYRYTLGRVSLCQKYDYIKVFLISKFCCVYLLFETVYLPLTVLVWRCQDRKCHQDILSQTIVGGVLNIFAGKKLNINLLNWIINQRDLFVRRLPTYEKLQSP